MAGNFFSNLLKCASCTTVNDEDETVWSRDLQTHSGGEFSYAAANANTIMQDYSQVETGPNAIFVGIYDGHGPAPSAPQFINNTLFDHLLARAREENGISGETLDQAIQATEEKFLEHVRETMQTTREIVVCGSCCLIGVIYKGRLMVANLGDSVAVLGRATSATDPTVIPEQLTVNHSCQTLHVRRELYDLHPTDLNILRPHAITTKFCIKGVLAVSRSIGDAYLKRSEFEVDPPIDGYQPIGPPIAAAPAPFVSTTPSMFTKEIETTDRFIIFASKGLWQHLTFQQAVNMVATKPKEGIAKALIQAAQKAVCNDRVIKYKDLIKMEAGPRMSFHDDMTVVVVFINHETVGQKTANFQCKSIKAFAVDGDDPQSNFSTIDDLMN